MKIIADEDIAGVDSVFARYGSVQTLPGREIARQHLRDADALLVRSITSINEDLLIDSSVRFVASATIGTDHIDLPWLTANEIGFSSAPGCNAQAVADFVLLSLLEAELATGEPLANKCLGVVGFGHVGKAVVERLRPLFKSVLVCDPPLAVNGHEDLVDFNTALQAEVVCCHTPLTTVRPYPTLELFSSAVINRIKPGSILLNAGRGGVIDETALLRRLEKAGDLTVILDVWAAEPQINRDLLKRCFLATPHIAGYSRSGKSKATTMIHRGFCEFFGYEPPISGSISEESHELQSQPDSLDPSKGLLLQLRQIEDIRQDDGALRQILGMSEQDGGRWFDQLRKTYRMRADLPSF